MVGIEWDPETAHKGWPSGWFRGLRFGTRTPGRLKAGHFYESEGWSFWDVGDPEQRGFKAALNALEAEKRVFDDPDGLIEYE
jgi:hypothetical protein